ncbi:MAG: signal recognition particle-docking protein FtsY [Euryarchaeota archaeon]|nr:signal recognition particle-docking protein FtsY [Euryarchaeota archaeon]|tara:strand:- start:3970 stop:5241 length:1272 start_codon:yes stop_codon:yes gene_type:complete
MGLFDRFKKRFKKSSKEEISVDEGSAEAKQASEVGAQMRKDIAVARDEPTPRAPVEEPDNEWDDEDDSAPDPFAAAQTDRKERKQAKRAVSVEQAKESEQPESTQSPTDPMQSTTGHKLVPTGPAKLEIDFGDTATKTGGRVITASAKLDSMLEELEEELLTSDMAQGAAEEVISSLKANLIGTRLSGVKKLDVVLEEALRHTLLRLLESGYWDFDKTVDALLDENTPVVIMVVGVNGTGKTTTTAKIAHRLSERGKSVVLAAADTFRAGAIDQLNTHAERIGVRCIRSQRGGDAAAVSRDAVDSAKAKGEDIVIIDTAGRMQNKTNLMEELRKVHRVTQPHLVLFVADALAGNDAVTQAVEFQRMLSFDGAALCKLDTDAKGGAALSIAHATGRPIVLAGVGQGYEDLLDFDPKWLVDTVLE